MEKYPKFVKISLFASPQDAKYASYYAALLDGNDFYGTVVLLEEVEIIKPDECVIPLFKETKLSEWKWCVSETLTGEDLDRVTEIYNAHAGISFNCEYMNFISPMDMLNVIQSCVDLYNVNTGEYVFEYNNVGSIAVYKLTREEAIEIRKKARGTGEYWGAFLGAGGTIWDDERHDSYVAGSGNLDYCKENYNKEGWINVAIS